MKKIGNAKQVKSLVSMAVALMMVVSVFFGMSISASAAQVIKVTSSVKSGSYSTVKKIDLRTPTNGAKIYYTTNGKTPTTTSTKYTVPFSLSKTTTVKAIAVKSGMLTSAVATFVYNINVIPTNLSGSVSMSGATALYPLGKNIADKFKAKNPNLSFSVSAGGSGTGLNNVLAKTVDIGMSDIYANEKLTQSQADQLLDHKVAVVGVATIVHPAVRAMISNVTKANLKKIFSGAISNWSEVGGPNKAIIIVNRPASSGTRALYRTWALDGQTDINGDASLTSDDSNSVAKTVSITQGAIGYLALSYVSGTSLSFGTLSIDGNAPSYSNIYTNKYKVWGYEHMYTNKSVTMKTAVKAYLDYIVSSNLTSTLEALGYGAISKLGTAAKNSR
ncbi:MAG: phosphate ABC transporter substrate-binding protein PstS family protein [Clostridia bacterium]